MRFREIKRIRYFLSVQEVLLFCDKAGLVVKTLAEKAKKGVEAMGDEVFCHQEPASRAKADSF